MLEILKDSDRRLVMTLGDRKSRWTKFILDKDAACAWFERRRRFWPERTLELRFKDIASIGTQTIARGSAVTETIVLTTTSNIQHRLAGEAGYARSAAERMRLFVGLERTEGAHVTRAASPLSHWGGRAATAAAVTATAAAAVWLVVMLGGFAVGAASKASASIANATGRVQTALLLPGCDAPASRDAILELARDRLGGGTVLDAITERGQSGGERLCGAVARRDGRVASVSYRNYFDGWTPKVRLTGEIVTAKLDAARTDAIAKAAETFLAASRNSHLTGKPPRQIEPAIDSALATVLGASDLAAEPLTTDEIDKALDWLKTADRIGAVYILAGTGFDDIANVPPADTIRKRIRGNVTAFADEFGRYADFQMILLAAIANAQARATTAPAAGKTSAQARTDEVRALLSQAMKGNLIALVYDGHNDSWRMARLTALGRTAPVAAKFLTRDDARTVRDLALQTVDYFKDATVRAKVREVAAMLQ
jgi:hypothetical protein